MIKRNQGRGRKQARNGAAVVEMAMCLPIFLLLFFGCYEFARANMMRHATEAAAYEGARAGIVPGATVADVEDSCRFVLSTLGINNFNIEVSPSPIQQDSDQITVVVSLRMRDNTNLGMLFNESTAFRGECTLGREGF